MLAYRIVFVIPPKAEQLLLGDIPSALLGFWFVLLGTVQLMSVPSVGQSCVDANTFKALS